ncbi:MAG: hypothetical protein ACRCV9_10175 [Burkholderiaceae bacterium]
MIHRLNTQNLQPALLVVTAVLLVFALAGCNKPAQPGTAQDTSAAGQGAAAVPSRPASSDKSSEDLAKIRAIKEAEEARTKAANQSTQEYADGVRKGAAAPVRVIK